MKRAWFFGSVLSIFMVFLVACGGGEEVAVEEAAALREASRNALLDQMVERPGPPDYTIGQVGGEYVSAINNDPRSFNTLTARDGDTGDVVNTLTDTLVDYDYYAREFQPNLASFAVDINEAAGTLRVIYTLRDDLFWTTPDSDPSTWVQLTADDYVFWYNEIEGDPAIQHPGYPGQFVDMPDGTQERITIEKLDDLVFAFNFPRIVAEPIFYTNMTIWPRHIFEPAKREGGAEGALNALSIDTDVTTIPSIGGFHIIEYSPGVRVVLQRNPNHWKTDAAGQSLPYFDRFIFRIVPDFNTEFLLFQEGDKDAHSVRPEDLDTLLSTDDADFTVYNGGESLGSLFFSFNQNPANLDPVKYEWFIRREFRQAMSSLTNRPRMVQQVYRGLASPAHHFFARNNPLFDPDIRLEYTYNPERAIELLASIGIEQGEDGLMYDSDGNHIEFDFIVGAANNTGIDMVQIFADEAAQVGITVNVRPIDFQSLVQRITQTYDWEAVIVAIGVNAFPSSGSNIWQSSGNFHLWHPLQESPVTEWEARIDFLYNEGLFTLDEDERRAIYEEYQRILLTELPLFYLVHQFAFLAVRDRWQNVYYDTWGVLPELEYFYLES